MLRHRNRVELTYAHNGITVIIRVRRLTEEVDHYQYDALIKPADDEHEVGTFDDRKAAIHAAHDAVAAYRRANPAPTNRSR